MGKYDVNVDTLNTWLAGTRSFRKTLTSPTDALAIVLPLLTDEGGPLEHERVVAVALNNRNKIIDTAVMTQGTHDISIVDPRQIGRWVLTREAPAAALVLAHNHPSGDPSPSHHDRRVTERVGEAMELLGIHLLDHIIVGGCGDWYSMKENGIIPDRYRRHGALLA